MRDRLSGTPTALNHVAPKETFVVQSANHPDEESERNSKKRISVDGTALEAQRFAATCPAVRSRGASAPGTISGRRDDVRPSTSRCRHFGLGLNGGPVQPARRSVQSRRRPAEPTVVERSSKTAARKGMRCARPLGSSCRSRRRADRPITDHDRAAAKRASTPDDERRSISRRLRRRGAADAEPDTRGVAADPDCATVARA